MVTPPLPRLAIEREEFPDLLSVRPSAVLGDLELVAESFRRGAEATGEPLAYLLAAARLPSVVAWHQVSATVCASFVDCDGMASTAASFLSITSSMATTMSARIGAGRVNRSS